MNTEVNTSDNISTTRAICSTAAAVSASYAAKPLLQQVAASIGNSIDKSLFADAAKKNDVFKEAAINLFKSEGIKYVDMAKEGSAEYLQKLGLNIKEIVSLKSGETAQAIFPINEICLNFDKIAIAAPHEGGHIKLQTSKNPLTKLINYLKRSFFDKKCYAIALTCAAILEATSNNNDDDNNKSKLEKLAGFLKEHCVGLAVLGYTPILVDEGMASIKGYNMFKKRLSASNRMLLGKFCTKAWLTYALTAAISAANVFITDKVKNALA